MTTLCNMYHKTSGGRRRQKMGALCRFLVGKFRHTYAPAPIGSDTTTSRHLLSFLDFVTCQYVNFHATHSYICMCLYPDLVPQRPPRREDCRAHQVFSTFASHEATTLWQDRVRCKRFTSSFGKPPPHGKVRPPSSMSA